MAVTVTNMKVSHKEAIVKVAGTAATGTIDISTLLSDNQALTDGGTPKVALVGYYVSTMPSASVTVTRNSVNIATIPGGVNDYVQFNMNGFVDAIEDDADIEVAIAGAEAQIYLILRKTDGFSSTHEPAYYGAYDDITAVGS